MMQYKRTRIKFCGMTTVADAMLAAQLGVDAIGLIFHQPSARNVSVEMANKIARSLPPFISRVGVVVNENSATIQSILDSVCLDIIQFHGQESADFCRSFGKPYIKTIHVDEFLTDEFVDLYPDALGFLFDTKIKNMPGGSGAVFNWKYISPNLNKPMILAGGLNIDNIHEAIKQVAPYAVDVTTGIEREKGIKDPHKMKQFIAKVTEKV